MEQLTKQVSDKHVPLGLDGRSLQEWRTAAVYQRILQDVVAATLSDRNGIRPVGAKLEFRQLYNFHYSDGAKMVTVGGVLYDEGQRPTLAACDFDDLPFVRGGPEACPIVAPNLTLRELRHLDSQLPAGHGPVTLPAVPASDVDAYSAVYRYFPAFAEAEL